MKSTKKKTKNSDDLHKVKKSPEFLKAQLPQAIGEERFDLLIDIVNAINYNPAEEANAYLDELLILAADLKSAKRLCKVHFLKAEMFRQGEKLQDCRHHFQLALKISEEKSRHQDYARSLRGIGSSYLYNNEPDIAEQYFEKAQHYSEKNGVMHEYIWSLNCLGNVYNSKFLYDKAMKILLKAIELSKAHKEDWLFAVSHLNIIGSISDPHTRVEYLERAVDGFLKRNSDSGTAMLYRQLSVVYHKVDIEKSLQYARKLLDIGRNNKVTRHLLLGYQSVLTALLKKIKLKEKDAFKNIVEARSLLDHFLPLAEKGEQKGIRFLARITNARICIYEKNFKKAKAVLLPLDTAIKNEGAFDKRHREVKEVLVEAYEGLGDYKTALQFYREFNELSQKIRNKEATQKANELEAQFESKEKEAEVQRLQELETAKTRFFSQITHELRTPLTLIQGPAQQILEKSTQQATRNQAHIIDRNASRLLSLVNQLLDLSKLEAGKMELNPSQGSLPPFIESVVTAFQTFAKQKQIKLNYNSNINELRVDIDIDKLEKLLYNLLSNAFKFTEKGGEINVNLKLLKQKSKKNVKVVITVKDTGKGISKEDLPHIFDRFYRADNSYTREAEGTGIGLALVKEIIELMKGKITVTSTLNKGTTFKIKLALKVATESQTETIISASKVVKKTNVDFPNTSNDLTKVTKSKKGLPILLLVEDNGDMHEYICSIFEHDFQILQAFNGIDGIEMALEQTPDIIISDVMMPGKDGYELCETLKKDQRSSHIPLILLTAKTAMKSRLKGFEQGADAYLSKPFNAQELQLQTKNLLATRTKSQEYYQEILHEGSGFEDSENQETVFLQMAIEVVEEHLNNEKLDVNMLSEKLSLSNSQVYRKIQALTNTNVVEFIRNIRLRKAKSMLEKKNGNVSTIAYQIGLSPSYFSRVFAKKYGLSPKALLKQSLA